MTDNVIDFPGVTRNDINPQKVLDNANKTGLENMIILGNHKDTGEFYFSSSTANVEKIIFMLETAKKLVMSTVKV